MTRLREALENGARRLAVITDEPLLEAGVLLAHAIGRPRSHLYAHPEAELGATEETRYRELTAGRAAGVPVAHLTARREFWSLDLETGPGALIPRPDTETLVEVALECLTADAPARILDLGTGTGAVAFAIAVERPRSRVCAVERSAAALDLARRNRERLTLPGVELLQGDWFAPVAGRRFELVLSNPPYVAAADPHLGSPELRHEPLEALVAGDDGLEAIRLIAAGATEHLVAGGWLLLEHGWDHGPEVRELLAAAGLREVFTRRDLAGRERVTGARRRV